jgi:putative transposase
LQDAQQRVDLAFKAFFRRVKKDAEKVGYPRFKSWARYDSLTYKQPWVGFRLDGDSLYLSKIGKVRIKLHYSGP